MHDKISGLSGPPPSMEPVSVAPSGPDVVKGPQKTGWEGKTPDIPLRGFMSPEIPSLPPPDIERLDVVSTLASIRSKVTEDMHKVCKTSIEEKREEHSELFKKRMENLQRAVEELKKAEPWGIAAKIFGWAIPALSVVAGGIVTIASFWTGVGAAVGVSLIAGGLIGLGAQGLQESGAMDEINKGVAQVFKSMGASEEEAKWLAFATITVTMFAATVIAGAATGGVAGLLTRATQTAAQAGAQAAGQAASQAVAQATTQAATKAGADFALKVGTSVVQAGVQASSSVVSIGKGVHESYSLFERADAENLQALMKNIEHKLGEQGEKLREIEEAYHKGNEIIAGVIRSQEKIARMVQV